MIRLRAQLPRTVGNVAGAGALLPVTNRDGMPVRQLVEGYEALLASMDIAVIALDWEGRVKFANELAERQLKTGEFLRVCNGQLTATDEGVSARLRALIRSVAERGGAAAAGAHLTVHAEARCLHLAIRALSAPTFGPAPRAGVMVAAFAPAGAPTRRERGLAELFGLTPAEIRVAMLLLEGLEPREIAGRTRSTYDAVRFQLKTIYRKAGVRRQCELVRLMSVLPGEPTA